MISGIKYMEVVWDYPIQTQRDITLQIALYTPDDFETLALRKLTRMTR